MIVKGVDEPETEIVPVRAFELVFSVTEKLTVPFPLVPLPPEVTVIHETVGIAVQLGQAAALVTEKLPFPAALATDVLLWLRYELQETGSCVTVNGDAAPETEIVPTRWLVPVFSATE